MSYSSYKLLFANNAGSSLAGPITNTATSLNLSSGGGALFPNPSSGQAFVLTAVDSATGLLREVMLCTARATDNLTVIRGQEGTTALNWLAGDLIQQLWTAGQAADMLQLNSSEAILYVGTFGGTANALTATVVGAPSTLVAGIVVIGEYAHDNTAATTFDLNSLGAVACYRDDNTAFAGGEAVTNGLGMFVYDGNYWILLSQLPLSFLSAPHGSQLLTAPSGNFTVPANVFAITVTAVGAGGGSGGCTTLVTYNTGASGGGGAMAKKTITGLTPGTVIPYLVGVGGIGGTGSPLTQPGAGGTTSFGAYVSCTGTGTEGETNSGPLINIAGAGVGGIATGGDINIKGAPGGTYWEQASGGALVAAAAGTAPGNPPAQPVRANAGYAISGVPGANRGDAGSSAITTIGGSYDGGAGADGYILVTW